MPEPPFDVSIHVEGTGRGVYMTRPIANGVVDGPNGPVEVRLSIQQLAPRPGEPEPPEEPMKFGVSVGDRGLTIDVTDMLEAIARKLLTPDDEPPKARTLKFKTRDK